MSACNENPVYIFSPTHETVGWRYGGYLMSADPMVSRLKRATGRLVWTVRVTSGQTQWHATQETTFLKARDAAHAWIDANPLEASE